jgi:choloylglycine hydrolase
MTAPKLAAAVLAGTVLACGGGQPSTVPDSLAAVSRLVKVHDYPMYLLDYQGDYRLEDRLRVGDLRAPVSRAPQTTAWACSAFAAFGDATRPLVGRSFDWRDHAAILLRTAPGRLRLDLDGGPASWASAPRTSRASASARQPSSRPVPAVRRLNSTAWRWRSSPSPRPGLRGRTATLGPLPCPAGLTALTVSEALRLPAQPPGRRAAVHFFLADATGQAAVVEYVDGASW